MAARISPSWQGQPASHLESMPAAEASEKMMQATPNQRAGVLASIKSARSAASTTSFNNSGWTHS
eukprot:4341782-Lingulodinium_polyedra.AAC.1